VTFLEEIYSKGANNSCCYNKKGKDNLVVASILKWERQL